MNKIIEWLEKINSKDKKIALVIRHGEREEFPPNSFGNDVPLTENGIKESERLGRMLAEKNIAEIFTSPVLRCVQTAESMVRGMCQNIKITKENMLGNPGLHISDSNLAGELYLKYGGIGVFEKFVGDEHILGIASKDFLKTAAKEWFCKKCIENGITIFITHDVLIAHFAHANNLHTYSKEKWVGFLDGIIIDF